MNNKVVRWLVLTIMAIEGAIQIAFARTETVLNNFISPVQMFYDSPSLSADGSGNFYGVAAAGGVNGAGVVFRLSPNDSGGWLYAELYSFCSQPSCTDGSNPIDSVIVRGGSLFGVTYGGGDSGAGVVYQLAPNGSGWTETVLASLSGFSAFPLAGLAIDFKGNLWGTSWIGHSVFELSRSGAGWTLQQIYDEGGDGNAYAPLVADRLGNIYGVTFSTVFQLSPNGLGGWNRTVLHTFTGSPNDGYDPYGGPALDDAGNVYGATTAGGANNLGTVYKIGPQKDGTWNYEMLYSFGGSTTDGTTPVGIVLDRARNIFVSASGGGEFNAGALVELVAPSGTGTYKERILWNFTGTDGAYPRGAVVADKARNGYGITVGGGTSQNGVIFKIAP